MPLTLEERIHCVRLYSQYGKPSSVQLVWRKKFGTDPPSTRTIVAINKKFDYTGSILDEPRPGRPKTCTTSKNYDLVEDALKQDPKRSLRSLEKDLGLARSSVMRIKGDLERKGNLQNLGETIKLKRKTVNGKVKIGVIKSIKSNSGATLLLQSPSKEISVPNVIPLNVDKKRITTRQESSNSNTPTMILTTVMSSTENGTQVLHFDPETFSLLQAHCSTNVDNTVNNLQNSASS